MNLYTIAPDTLAGHRPIVFVEENGEVVLTSDPGYAPVGDSLTRLLWWCREVGHKVRREEMPAPADV